MIILILALILGCLLFGGDSVLEAIGALIGVVVGVAILLVVLTTLIAIVS